MIAPAADAVEYRSVKFNVTTTGNRFVGAGPEVDKAWREISYDSRDPLLPKSDLDGRARSLSIANIFPVGDQFVSPAELSKLGMPETSLKVTDPKTGAEGYRVGMEAFHQLHCINLLRRVTYKDYYEPLGGEFGHGREALQAHTGESA